MQGVRPEGSRLNEGRRDVWDARAGRHDDEEDDGGGDGDDDDGDDDDHDGGGDDDDGDDDDDDDYDDDDKYGGDDDVDDDYDYLSTVVHSSSTALWSVHKTALTHVSHLFIIGSYQLHLGLGRAFLLYIKGIK